MHNFQYTKIHIIIAVKWVFYLSEYTKIDVRCRFTPDPTGGAYSTLPEPLVGFKGSTSRQEGNVGEGTDGLGEGGREEVSRKGGMGRESRKGEVGGIVPWLLGERRHWLHSQVTPNNHCQVTTYCRSHTFNLVMAKESSNGQRAETLCHWEGKCSCRKLTATDHL